MQDPYGYKRAFTHTIEVSGYLGNGICSSLRTRLYAGPDCWRRKHSIRSGRDGDDSYANDLNPVAATILIATVEFPANYGVSVLEQFVDSATILSTGSEAEFSECSRTKLDDCDHLGLSVGSHRRLSILRGTRPTFSELATFE